MAHTTSNWKSQLHVDKTHAHWDYFAAYGLAKASMGLGCVLVQHWGVKDQSCYLTPCLYVSEVATTGAYK